MKITFFEHLLPVCKPEGRCQNLIVTPASALQTESSDFILSTSESLTQSFKLSCPLFVCQRYNGFLDFDSGEVRGAKND